MTTQAKVLTALLVAGLSLSGCVTQRVQAYKSQSTLYADQADLLGEMTALQMRMVFKLAYSPQAWDAVEEVFSKLRSTGKTPNAAVFVLDSPVPNAFALPHGKIYITTGMLRLLGTESGLAGVLAHELAHIEKAHYQSRLNRGNWMFGPVYLVNHFFDQAEELEADRTAIQVMARAGYSPQAFLDFLNDLRLLEGRWSTRFGGFGTSHPAVGQRMAAFKRALAEENPSSTMEVPQAKSARFLAMREAFRAEDIAYRPSPMAEEVPPRFKSGDSRFDQRLLEANQKIEMSVDLFRTQKALEEMATDASSDGKKTAAVEMALARISLLQGDHGATEAHLAKAEKAWPSLQTPSWLRVLLLWDRGDRSAAEAKWRSIFNDSACAANLECLRLGAQVAVQILDDSETAAAAAATYREALLHRQSGDTLSAEDSATLSLTGITEIQENIRKNPEDRQMDLALPKGFHPSLNYSDWKHIEAKFVADHKSFEPVETGMTLGFAFSGSATSGALSPLLGTGATAGLWWGWRFWPSELGFDFSGALSRKAVTLAGEVKHELAHLGLYYRRDWKFGRSRPWVKPVLSWSMLNDTNAKQRVSSGLGAGLDLGYSYRINRLRDPNDFFVVVSGGVRQAWLKPVAGGPDGSAMSWNLGLGIEFLMNRGAQKEALASDLNRYVGMEPPNFF